MRVILLPDAATAQAMTLQDGPGSALNPRQVAAGVYMGRWVLPVAVLDDAAHAAHRAQLASYPQADIDQAVAWPVTDELLSANVGVGVKIG